MEQNILQNDIPAYIIVPEELGALRQFLYLQSAFPSTNSFTEAAVAEYYIDILHRMGNSYGEFKNGLMASWVKSFTEDALKIANFEEIVVTRRFYEFCSSDPSQEDILYRFSEPWISFWHAFMYSWRWRDAGDQDNYFGPAYPRSVAPDGWRAASDKLFTDWGNNPPEKYIIKGGGNEMSKYATYRAHSKKEVDAWITANKTKLSTSRNSSWTLQETAATAIMSKEQLTASDYFFFFHLFVASASGNANSQALVKKIYDKKETSIVYKNETFTNHLIYVVLLFLCNPNDRYQWSNEKLRSFVQSTKDNIPATDEVSVAIKTGLEKFDALLSRNDGFPFAARGDFNNRLVNTLGKLDKMRKS